MIKKIQAILNYSNDNDWCESDTASFIWGRRRLRTDFGADVELEWIQKVWVTCIFRRIAFVLEILFRAYSSDLSLRVYRWELFQWKVEIFKISTNSKKWVFFKFFGIFRYFYLAFVITSKKNYGQYFGIDPRNASSSWNFYGKKNFFLCYDFSVKSIIQ